MSSKGKKLKKKQKQRLMKLFFKTVVFTVLVCGLLMGTLVGCYNHFIKVDTPNISGGGSLKPNKNDKNNKDKNINKNVAVFGVDEDGYRTDVIFVVNFNSETNEVNIVSVPRDTKVLWTDEQNQSLQALGKGTRRVSKINEMTSYSGIENIDDFTVNQLENMLGISIDNYVIVSLDTFKKVVDAIGGVEMYVPQNMYYVDNYAGLYINLKEGQQVLDGDKAEQLIRFRRYPEGDVARVRTQQKFIEAFIDTILRPSMIMKIPDLINVMFESVQTDVSLFEIPQYYPYVKTFDADNIEFHLLPGEGRMENGISYFFPDMNEMEEFVQVAFYNKPTQEELEKIQKEENEAQGIITDKTISIEILNGSGITGAAGKEEDRLEAEGYNVHAVGNYERSNVEKTMIFAKDISLARQFERYYEGVQVEENKAISYDVQIVLGAQRNQE